MGEPIRCRRCGSRLLWAGTYRRMGSEPMATVTLYRCPTCDEGHALPHDAGDEHETCCKNRVGPCSCPRHALPHEAGDERQASASAPDGAGRVSQVR